MKAASEHPEVFDYVATSIGSSNSDFKKLCAVRELSPCFEVAPLRRYRPANITFHLQPPASQIIKAVPAIRFICLDVANGYSQAFVDAVRRVREAFPKRTILAGNVVTGEMVEELILSGADIVKVKQEPHDVCTRHKPYHTCTLTLLVTHLLYHHHHRLALGQAQSAPHAARLVLATLSSGGCVDGWTVVHGALTHT